MLPSKSFNTLFFRNKRLLFLSIMLIFVAGFSALTTMPRIEDPRFTHRNPIVLTRFPGASASRVESLVTEKLENALQEVPEISKITSSSRPEISVINIQLEDQTTSRNNQAIFSKIRDKLKDAQVFLPKGVEKPVFDDSRTTAYTFVYALIPKRQKTSLNVLSRLSEELAHRLRSVPGTELVKLYGKPQEEFSVTVNPHDLATLGISMEELSQSLALADPKGSAGIMRSPKWDIPLEVSGELDSIKRIASVPILHNAEGNIIQLGDIAKVGKNQQDPLTEIALSGGTQTIYVAALVRQEEQVHHWAQKIQKEGSIFQKEVGGFSLKTVFNQSEYTQARLEGLVNNLYAGSIVVILVIFFFMGWRSAVIVSLALPLSISITLFGLMMIGEQLQQMTIFGMIIAIGLLIDNAIVITEEISAKIRQNISRQKALEQTINHLFVPLGASTLTTILGFMPIFLLSGNMGDFASSMAYSVIIALVSSFLVSMTIIPSLAALFLGDASSHWWEKGISPAYLRRIYKQSIHKALCYPLLTCFAIALFASTGFVALFQLEDLFFPAVDRDQFEIRVWGARDTSILHTQNHIEGINQQLEQFSQIEDTHWLIGGGFPPVYYNLMISQDKAPFYAQGIIKAKSFQDVKILIPSIQNILEKNYPNLQIYVGQFGQGPPMTAPIEFRVSGPNIAKIQEYGRQIRQLLSQEPDVLFSQSTIQEGSHKIWVEVDPYQSQLANLKLQQISSQLQKKLEGQMASSVMEEREEIPIRIKIASSYRENFQAIASTELTASGSKIPLSSISKLRLKPEIGEITHYQNKRCNQIYAYVKMDVLPIEICKRLAPKINQLNWTDSYHWEIGGNSKEKKDALQNLTRHSHLIALLILAILVLSFNSFFLTALITVVAFLSVGFGILALWMADYALGFNPILGCAGLIGIALNDSIVVLAALQRNPKARAGNPEAICQEIMNCTRHILSTTVTTMGGFLPFLLFTEGSFWPPLAIVIVGGVAGATLLSLFFSPMVFYCFASWQNKREAVK